MSPSSPPLPPSAGLLVLLRGLPGVGKTTLATAVAAATGLPVLCKDDVRDTLVKLERRLPPPLLPLRRPPPPPPPPPLPPPSLRSSPSPPPYQADGSRPSLPSAAKPSAAPAAMIAVGAPDPNPPSATDWNDAAYTILYSLARTQLLAARLPGVLVEAPLVRASAVAAAATAVLGAADPPSPPPLRSPLPPHPPPSPSLSPGGVGRLLVVDCTCGMGEWAARLAARADKAAAAAATVGETYPGGGEHRPTTVAAVRAYYGGTDLEPVDAGVAADVLAVDTGRELGEVAAEVAAWVRAHLRAGGAEGQVA